MGASPERIKTKASQSDSAKTEMPNKSGSFETDHRGNQKTLATSAGHPKAEIGKSGKQESAG